MNKKLLLMVGVLSIIGSSAMADNITQGPEILLFGEQVMEMLSEIQLLILNLFLLMITV